MKAVQYREIGKGPEVVEIDIPEPGPGQIRLKVDRRGALPLRLVQSWTCRPSSTSTDCRSPSATRRAGIVDKLGAGVEGIEVGGSYAVYGPWGCGQCRAVLRGPGELTAPAPPNSASPRRDWAPPAPMAEYLIVDDARHLVPLGDLDPVADACR